MEKNTRIVQVIFGLPWLVFGVQHFMYAEFVAGLVPAYFPVRIFWALLTGTAMIAAGLSFIFNKKAPLAAALLGVMIAIFIFLIHIPTLAGEAATNINWTRALQDVSIAGSAFILAGILSKREGENNLLEKTAHVSRYLLAVLLIVFGIEEFLDLDFLTAKVAVYLPLRTLWVYLAGGAMIITGASILINKKARLSAMLSGILMLTFNLLHHGYLLATDPFNPRFWTAAMINLAITCGVFIVAASLTERTINKPD